MLKMAAACQRLNPTSDSENATFDPEEDRAILEEIATWHKEAAIADQGDNDDD